MTLRYRHIFRVRAPLSAVAEFHARPEGLKAITPPPVLVQWHRTPAQWKDGSEMEFTVWLGPLPMRWLARIEGVFAEGFTDRQVRGPFRAWRHRHRYLAVGDATTELFAYRGWRTKRLLEGR